MLCTCKCAVIIAQLREQHTRRNAWITIRAVYTLTLWSRLLHFVRCCEKSRGNGLRFSHPSSTNSRVFPHSLFATVAVKILAKVLHGVCVPSYRTAVFFVNSKRLFGMWVPPMWSLCVVFFLHKYLAQCAVCSERCHTQVFYKGGGG